MTAPERIWAWRFMVGERSEYMQGGWDDKEDKRETEYIRADLHAAEIARLTAERDAALAGRVKVKPLVWTQQAPPGFDHEPFVYWASGIGGHYRAEPDGMLWMAHDEFVWQQHPSQAAAKAAAQADYEARILAALEPQPDTVQDAAQSWRPIYDAPRHKGFTCDIWSGEENRRITDCFWDKEHWSYEDFDGGLYRVRKVPDPVAFIPCPTAPDFGA